VSAKRADVLLVERGLFESRARAQAAIAAGLVTVNGIKVRKASETIGDEARIAAAPAHPYVSRGGVKLAFALDHFGIAASGRVALDVGASTGGFTDVLLKRGAARIYAVDTGRDQLHASLRGDPRVVSLEATDVRRLGGLIGEPVSLVVVDVSFISATLVLGPALDLAGPGADLVVLVKPQFEAGRGHVGRNGIVRDPAVHEAVTAAISAHVEGLGLAVRGIVPSPIAGGDGNREFLLAARRA
jgi:23S rRNA (cytidine1920-2'-O)/16S rRNA (cytidine1409-2'-O)-methyltransferase